MRNQSFIFIMLCSLYACGSSSTPPPTANIDPCQSSGIDSVNNNGTITRIRSESEGCASYKLITSSRKKASGIDVSLDYMLHDSVGTEKAIMVLIAGGNMDSSIIDTNADGIPDTGTSGNFLVRSAHLFADRGYKVITLDRPDDYADYIAGFDTYRTSVNHAVDIINAVNTENTSQLPVFIIGTSRGAISAVFHSKLASGISISSPVTSGSGTPLISGTLVDPANVSNPAHLIWHTNDLCSLSTPAESAALIGQFAGDFASDSFTGGFKNPAVTTECKAQTFHGFMGIETTAVNSITTWADNLLSTLPVTAPRPGVTGATSTPTTVTKVITLGATGSGPFTYSLPYNTSSLDVALTLSGDQLTYIAPAVSNTLDNVIFKVTDINGSSRIGIVEISVTP